MDDLTRTQPDLMRTQPLDTSAVSARTAESRSFRLLRTVIFALAVAIGIATVVVLATREEEAPPNSSGVFSPSGHLPSRASRDRNVSISWSRVEGAAGYWWAMVEDPTRLPRPVIRPSGNDRRVYFRFSGRGYFALRTAFRVDGRLRWSDELLYGPIIVRDPAAEGPVPASSPAASGVAQAGAGDSGEGGQGSALGSGGPRSTPVDPRYAGQPGECPPGASPAQCGGAGQPGQPAQAPGGGGGPGRSGMSPGEPGADGPDGPPG